MLDYLCRSLVTAEGLYLGCGIVNAGDFNHLNIEHLCYEFNLTQLVNAPTRGTNTLDLVIKNLNPYYKRNLPKIYPPFGLSDHSSVVIRPSERPPKGIVVSNHTIIKRNTQPSRKKELGRNLNQLNWQILDSVNT